MVETRRAGTSLSYRCNALGTGLVYIVTGKPITDCHTRVVSFKPWFGRHKKSLMIRVPRIRVVESHSLADHKSV